VQPPHDTTDEDPHRRSGPQHEPARSIVAHGHHREQLGCLDEVLLGGLSVERCVDQGNNIHCRAEEYFNTSPDPSPPSLEPSEWLIKSRPIAALWAAANLRTSQMPYIVVAVETSIPWTTAETTVKFEGQVLTLRPGSKTLFPTVVLKYAPDTRERYFEGLELIRRFLSSIAWTDRSGIKDVMTSGGGFPVNLGRSDTFGVTVMGNWRVDCLPEPADKRARLALALYREALNLEHVSIPYAFLGLFKILNIGLPTGKKQIEWTNAAIPNIKDHRAVERLTELRASEPDLGEYLYASGRCAVAHAFNDPTINPDDTADTLRLSRDFPVARALAEHFIESELGIKSYSTILSEHLYELDGFRKIFGDAAVQNMKAGEAAIINKAPNFPRLTIRLDGKEAKEIAFVGVAVTAIGITKGAVILYCVSSDKRLKLALGLDFANERLVFDPEGGISVTDDGSVEAVDHEITAMEYFRGMILNGRTEVISAETGERLGRTDAFVGVNIDLTGTIDNLDRTIAKLKEERNARTATQEGEGKAAGK
jgi:hypothetical protein